MRVSATAYPWDASPSSSVVPTLLEAGVHDLVLAAVYHSVRAATPQDSRRRVVDAAWTASYLDLDPQRWAGRALAPAAPGSWSAPGEYERAAAYAQAEGLTVSPWVVLLHDSRIGRARPDLTVLNAWSERYPYALCPSHAEVHGYAAELVRQVVRVSGAERVVVEACGPLGVAHLASHEKTAGAGWTPEQRRLLSVCFCAACSALYGSRGLDADRLRHLVRAGWDDPDGDWTTSAEAAAVLQVRRECTASLADQVAGTARERDRVSVAFHASTDPCSTGPFVAIDGVVGAADVLWLPADEVRRDPAGLDRRRAGRPVVAAANIAHGYDDERLRGEIEQLARVPRLQEISLGHVGLVPGSTVRAAVAALR